MGFQLEENRIYNAQDLIDMLNSRCYRTMDSNNFFGVYKIYNTQSKKYYVGSAAGPLRGIKSRWYGHLFDLRKNNHHSVHLQKAWNLYGASCFEFSIIEKIDIDYNDVKGSKQKIRDREQYYFEVYDVLKNGYNTTETADGGGYSLTEDWIKEGRSKQVNWDQYLYIKDKLINTDMPLVEIARNCGCRKDFIKQIYERKTLFEVFKNIEFPKRRIRRLAKLNEEEKQDICQKYLSNISIKKLSKEYRVSPQTINDLLDEKKVKNKGSVTFESGKVGRPIFVYQYTLDGEYIKSFNSAMDAAKEFGKETCSKIISCCKGKMKSAYGYCWSYKQMEHLPKTSLEEQILGKPISSRLRPVIQYDLNWNPIKLFPSLRSTGKEIKNTSTGYMTIARNMKLNLNDTETFGYKWKYSDLAPKEDLYKLLELKG